MKFLKSLSLWVLIAFISGAALGIINPQVAQSMEIFGTLFIKIIKIFVPFIVFFSTILGIAKVGSMKSLAKIGCKAFIYFEAVTTLALLTGWAAVSLFKPGKQVHADLNLLQQHSLNFLNMNEPITFSHFLQSIIPSNFITPFIKGDVLQVLVMGMAIGFILLILGKCNSKLVYLIEKISEKIFTSMQIVMFASPIGVFGAIAFTVGKFGAQFLLPLLSLIAVFYVTVIFFVFVVLGAIAYFSGFSIWRLLQYLFPELLIILGTSSSEPVLPNLLKKLQALGCKQQTISLVVPMGYSFNLDGTSIYLTIGAIFIAQALGIHLTMGQQLELFGVALLSSKGTAGVSGTGFVMLAATLTMVPVIPLAGIVLLLGVDRFMSEARSLTNFIGNAVAALVISRWQKDINAEVLQQNIALLPASLTTQSLPART